MCFGGASGGGSRATFRLYSLAVYEAESDEPTHFYTPCKKDGKVGLWDSCDKEFKEDFRNVYALEIGGAGVGGSGFAFLEHPQGGQLKKDHTITLEAYAPGAVHYQWLKNGNIVEGATGRTLEVSWVQGSRTDAYQCVSHYEVFGYGVSNVAQVENMPSGMIILFR